MSPLLTVIVPCYNMEKYIAKTLESLVRQTSDQIKVLVIDDGSTDNTLEIVNEYVNRYHNVSVISKENGGISSARNCGIQNVDTPYFGFVDSDDYVELDMFENMLKKIQEEDSDVCVCNFIWEWSDRIRQTKEGPYFNSEQMITKLYATLWNKIYKTELIKKYDLSFPVGYRYEDAYFLYCLASNPLKVSFVEGYYVHYVQREGSITHTHNDKVKDMIEVFHRIKDYYSLHHGKDAFHDELEFLFAKFFLGNSFLRTCQIKDAKERNRTLDLSWKILTDYYPNFKYNDYLKKNGVLKRMYYKVISKWNYHLIGELLHIVYNMKGGM